MIKNHTDTKVYKVDWNKTKTNGKIDIMKIPGLKENGYTEEKY